MSSSMLCMVVVGGGLAGVTTESSTSCVVGVGVFCDRSIGDCGGVVVLGCGGDVGGGCFAYGLVIGWCLSVSCCGSNSSRNVLVYRRCVVPVAGGWMYPGLIS